MQYQQKQHSLIAFVRDSVQQLETFSKNFAYELNQTKESFSSLSSFVADQLRIVKILNWDPGKYVFPKRSF